MFIVYVRITRYDGTATLLNLITWYVPGTWYVLIEASHLDASIRWTRWQKCCINSRRKDAYYYGGWRVTCYKSRV